MPEWKKGIPNFLFVIIYVYANKIYTKEIFRNLEKSSGKIGSILLPKI